MTLLHFNIRFLKYTFIYLNVLFISILESRKCCFTTNNFLQTSEILLGYKNLKIEIYKYWTIFIINEIIISSDWSNLIF